MLAVRPLRIYSTGEKHWRQYSRDTSARPIIVKAASHTKVEMTKHRDIEVEKLKARAKEASGRLNRRLRDMRSGCCAQLSRLIRMHKMSSRLLRICTVMMLTSPHKFLKYL
jgi:hypothetical protein